MPRPPAEPWVRPPFFDDLRHLRVRIGWSAGHDDIMAVLIEACIDGGVDTERQIVLTMRELGYKRKDTLEILELFSELTPPESRWFKRAGKYELLSSGNVRPVGELPVV